MLNRQIRKFSAPIAVLMMLGLGSTTANAAEVSSTDLLSAVEQTVSANTQEALKAFATELQLQLQAEVATAWYEMVEAEPQSNEQADSTDTQLTQAKE
ncbi:hypothetical protein [Shewanella sedimentimangrovi]|uniref:Uncharacterized protein n=1 Tax=Shewanella sedimentimangrovi TaxID=2814293 RepID=A0ABX7R054_9GAMM|nr:hypothetical protein [Shewanella sedimentimangrovi]QSX36682.1 hypothetical protein JYB85_15595 [Shewanella sedimentimangrovi]